ncbi:NADH:ubiquinone oxidoreductase subunit [Coleophoma crateriformis]|uniref:NADH dehydrogenase [ubiquinone] iron-sulfur protein 5 n=1 Tax=Coleophoma crateriformis TaxID=565419 RepID=A0A3D8SAJ6_9HELO|nr:NADH:ubiquinone oxidoreductase subunit [Coleophoma crateriformis]
MASGYGNTGGQGRCFPFWQEVLSCYVVNTADGDASGKKKCAPVLEDYYECLHHKKEEARVSSIQQAYRKQAKLFPREDAPKAGSIRNLGLLDKEEDTKAVLGK